MINPTIQSMITARKKRRMRFILITAVLTLLSLSLACAMMMLGHTIYPVQDIIRVLMGETVPGASFAITEIRLPRTLAGLFAGFAFGVGGYIFQTMLRNPLANPDVIGVTAGSSASAVFCIIVLHASHFTVSIASIVGGLVTVCIIYVLSKKNAFSIGRLILIGIGIQAMLNAAISYIMLIGKTNDLPTALVWLSGSLNNASMPMILTLLLCIICVMPFILYCSKQLEMLELGEQAATALGVNTNKTRIILIFCAVCMIALATATTGPIAFVAFLAGPIAQRLVGFGFSNIIPAGLIGIILVLGADLIGQFAFETRYPVGVITGIVGAPYLIYLLIRINRKGDI
ncbi:iron ABC transporter [Kurthia sp. 3B1D]|uniref:Iron ABC transporter n=1 Tax=Candidatus Kurthia intestinigallinarum TaxID=1562256 RepID=A0A433RV82_9BACL|nr:iron chelate uptake ABC transporter family permease subunit [Kurthia sp. 3B1D]RUS57184.1 iron ABC transporter [Kurthia sp. 3B1D]